MRSIRGCHLFVFVLAVYSFAPLASAFFFPNISAIPKDFVLNATKNAWDSFQNLSGCNPGQTLDGLAKLKKYFHYFGYLPPSPSSNFTDYFDDSLESAIRTYQRNFNLNVTGLLDRQTLQHIQRPRCGNADIVNGSTSMNSGKASTPFHYVAHYSFFPGAPRWTKSRLTYAFLAENQLSNDSKSVFSRAFDRWSEVTPLTFQLVDNPYMADIRIGFYSGDHGDGEPFDGVLGTLAHAFSPPSGRFHLDGDENWVVSGDIGRSSLDSAVDLESVAVHEIGHLLGLGHSSVEESIMYPAISSRTRKVDLANDDIQGVQQLYGSNPNYNGSSSSTTPSPTAQERDTSGARVANSWLGLTISVSIAAVGSVFYLL